MSDSKLSHLDEDGRARMVDVGGKPVTQRRARAGGQLICLAETVKAVREGTTPKGAVITTAEIAGIMAAKRTAELIPMCHQLNLSHVKVVITPDEALPGFVIESEVRLSGQTGVEMEALTAASVAGLTLYDMLKAIDKTMVLQSLTLLHKEGGKSGVGGG